MSIRSPSQRHWAQVGMSWRVSARAALDRLSSMTSPGQNNGPSDVLLIEAYRAMVLGLDEVRTFDKETITVSSDSINHYDALASLYRLYVGDNWCSYPLDKLRRRLMKLRKDGNLPTLKEIKG